MHRLSQSPRLRLLAAMSAIGLIACVIAAPISIAGSGKGQSQAQSARSLFEQKKSQAAKLRTLLGGDGLISEVGPPDEALKPIAEKLNKKLKIQFLDTPFNRVIEFLQRESGVTFLINHAATAGREDNPVSLEADEMTIKEAIDWSCVATGTDWDVIKGVIVISTPAAIQARHLETRVYDVRSLLVQMPHFSGGPEFDLNSALSNTSSGGSSGAKDVLCKWLKWARWPQATQIGRAHV